MSWKPGTPEMQADTQELMYNSDPVLGPNYRVFIADAIPPTKTPKPITESSGRALPVEGRGEPSESVVSSAWFGSLAAISEDCCRNEAFTSRGARSDATEAEPLGD